MKARSLCQGHYASRDGESLASGIEDGTVDEGTLKDFKFVELRESGVNSSSDTDFALCFH